VTGVVDAFITELGIDPRGVEEGRKKAAASLAQLNYQNLAGAKKSEESFKKVSDAFEATGKRVLAYTSIILGGATLKSLIQGAVTSDRIIGILSDTTGDSVENISKWRYAFERMGGSAEGITEVIRGISHEMSAMATGAPMSSSSLITVLNALTYYGVRISARDKSGNWRKPTEILLDIVDALSKLDDSSKKNVAGVLRRITGIDEATIAVMMKGGDAIKRALEDQDKIAKTTVDSRAAADNLTRSWREMNQRADQLGRTVMEGLAKPLAALFDSTSKLLKLVDTNQKEMSKSWEQRDYEMRTRLGLPVYTGYKPPGASGEVAPPSSGSDSVSPPSEVLAKAEILIKGGGSPGDLERFMASQGYPKNGNWCGQFAAAVVKAGGGTPPKNAPIASMWRTWGESVDDPKPGDIAVRRGVPTGATGSHVGFVRKVYPDGSVDILGGNQGRVIAHHPPGTYDFRRGLAPPVDDTFSKKQAPLPFILGPSVMGPMSEGRIVRKNETVTTNRTVVDKLEVHTQATNPVDIAGEVHDEIRKQGTR
jgi:hypothetical protein